jgi:hypothetical protein
MALSFDDLESEIASLVDVASHVSPKRGSQQQLIDKERQRIIREERQRSADNLQRQRSVQPKQQHHEQQRSQILQVQKLSAERAAALRAVELKNQNISTLEDRGVRQLQRIRELEEMMRERDDYARRLTETIEAQRSELHESVARERALESRGLVLDDDNMLVRDQLRAMYDALRAVSADWKFGFQTSAVDARALQEMMMATDRLSFFKALHKIFGYCSEEIAKLRMVVETFEKRVEEQSDQLNKVQIEVHELRNFKADYLANREGFLKKLGNKVSGEKHLSELGRRRFERDLIESERLLKEATAARSKLTIEVRTLDRLNKRLQARFGRLEKQVADAQAAGFVASRGGGDQGPSADEAVANVPIARPSEPIVCDAPRNKFAPPGSVANPSQVQVQVQQTSNQASSSSSSSSSLPSDLDSLAAQLGVLSPSADDVAPTSAAEREAMARVTKIEAAVARIERMCGSFTLPPQLNDATSVLSFVTGKAREIVQQTRSMSNSRSRDYRLFGRTAGEIVAAALRLLQQREQASRHATLSLNVERFADTVHMFLPIAMNSSIVFDQPPPNANVNTSLVGILQQLKMLCN